MASNKNNVKNVKSNREETGTSVWKLMIVSVAAVAIITACGGDDKPNDTTSPGTPGDTDYSKAIEGLNYAHVPVPVWVLDENHVGSFVDPAPPVLEADGVDIGGPDVTDEILPNGRIVISNAGDMILGDPSIEYIPTTVKGSGSTHLELNPDPEGPLQQSLSNTIDELYVAKLVMTHNVGTDGNVRTLGTGSTVVTVYGGAVVPRIGEAGGPESKFYIYGEGDIAVGFNVVHPPNADHPEEYVVETLTELQTGEIGTIENTILTFSGNLSASRLTSGWLVPVGSGVKKIRIRDIDGGATIGLPGNYTLDAETIDPSVTIIVLEGATLNVETNNATVLTKAEAASIVSEATGGLSGTNAAAFIQGNPVGEVVRDGKIFSSEEVEGIRKLLEAIETSRDKVVIDTN